MTDIKAAELPEGSVVATDIAAFIRIDADPPWRSTYGSHVGDWKVDQALQIRGATVLRHGYGDEGES